MPFRLFKSSSTAAPLEPAPAPAPAELTPRIIRFVGLSDEAIVEADLALQDRLSDMLNRRVALAVSNCAEAPLADDGEVASESSRSEIDPYEFLLVFTAAESTPDYDRAAKMAHRLRKLPHRVSMQVGPFEVSGVVHLFPKVEIEDLMGRATELFMPVTEAEVRLDGRRLGAVGLDTVLVNRNDLYSVSSYSLTGPAAG